jgi:hypothetical protein
MNKKANEPLGKENRRTKQGKVGLKLISVSHYAVYGRHKK